MKMNEPAPMIYVASESSSKVEIIGLIILSLAHDLCHGNITLQIIPVGEIEALSISVISISQETQNIG